MVVSLSLSLKNVQISMLARSYFAAMQQHYGFHPSCATLPLSKSPLSTTDEVKKDGDRRGERIREKEKKKMKCKRHICPYFLTEKKKKKKWVTR
jgi:hypothetical protein